MSGRRRTAPQRAWWVAVLALMAATLATQSPSHRQTGTGVPATELRQCPSGHWVSRSEDGWFCVRCGGQELPNDEQA